MSAPRISAAELDVMRVLWAEPGLAATDVHARLWAATAWTQRTVKTLLARLVEKGALTTETDGRRYLYHPAVEEAEYKAGAAGQFIDRLFEGRASDLVAYLADTRGLTDDDIAEIEKLIRELKK